MKHVVTGTLCAMLISLLSATAWGAVACAPCTGDTSNVPLWIGMGVAAIVLVVVLLIMMKKRK